MQHAVNVSTSGCCSTLGSKLPPNPFDFNLSFAQSVPGIFKILHIVVGVICLAVIAYACQFFHPLTGSSLGVLCSNSGIYFLLVSYGCFVTSLIILVSSLLSYFTASFLPKTAFEFGYHFTSCVLYLSASLFLLLAVTMDKAGTEPAYEAKIAASVMGLINSILYCISTHFSFKSLKQMS